MLPISGRHRYELEATRVPAEPGHTMVHENARSDGAFVAAQMGGRQPAVSASFDSSPKGLSSKDIAAQLVISPRTGQSHLHVCAKLGVPSRVQLTQETARHP
jgi:ATP/maltotriose-dependent transcriptional regulator MalT